KARCPGPDVVTVLHEQSIGTGNVERQIGSTRWADARDIRTPGVIQIHHHSGEATDTEDYVFPCACKQCVAAHFTWPDDSAIDGLSTDDGRAVATASGE